MLSRILYEETLVKSLLKDAIATTMLLLRGFITTIEQVIDHFLTFNLILPTCLLSEK